MRPTERRTAPDGVADIQPSATLDEKLHHCLMVAEDCLVQRRRMRMIAFQIIAIGILAGVKQQANDIRMSMLCSERQRALPSLCIRRWKQPCGIIQESEPRCMGQFDPRSAS